MGKTLAVVLFAAATLVFTLVIIEGLLRTDFFQYRLGTKYQLTHEIQETGFFEFTEDFELPYVMAPSTTHDFWWGDEFKTNRYGFLGDESSKDGALNVVFVGDSVTFGLGVGQHEIFPEVFRRLIPGTRVGMVAAPGYNTVHEVNALRRFLDESGFEPDLVVLQFGANDFLHPTRAVRTDRVHFYEEKPQIECGQVSDSWAALLDRSSLAALVYRIWAEQNARLEDSICVEPSTSKDRVIRAMQAFKELSQERGFDPVFVNVPYVDEHEPIECPVEHCLDLAELADDESLWLDSMHLNEKGHAAVATILAWDVSEWMPPTSPETR